jgi:predicted aldo/keto reductase-like oxidoreductase
MTKKDGLTRRQMIGTSAALGAGVLAARVDRAFAGKKAPEQVPRKVLGKTGKKIPILLFGAAVDLDPVFDRKLAEGVRYGVDYIDAARVYQGGRCEERVAAYLKKAKNRSKLWITSKSKQHDPKGYSRSLDRTLKELGTDYVDLYFLHALNDKDYLSTEMARTAERLKKAGKIRFVGFSCHHGNVAELLHAAAERSWIDAVMFRYNFRQYGNKELNKAIDAAAKANVGLIAMKTQGSAVSFKDEWKKYTGKWTKHQAVLKAVWDDDRITAAVSAMDNMKKLKQNIGAAVNKTKLSAAEREALERYALETRRHACDGCDQICGGAAGGTAAIGDHLRLLMYHDVYDEPDKARRLYRELPEPARDLRASDLRAAERACPHGVELVAHLERAVKVLS